MIFGRNYDWVADAGMLCTNLRGIKKTSFKASDGKQITWTSKYGSVTFNQYGKEFPTGGMNEKGLVVELMWLDGTKYPAPDERPAIGVLQWIQYQLDNSSTIEEVVASDETLRITSGGTPLHYLIADANGNAATIEFLDGKMIIHSGTALSIPVLTNDQYKNSIAAHSNGSADNNSLERFSTACHMVKQLPNNLSGKAVVDYSFKILENVSQGDFTKWSIVYDVKNRKVYFKTQRFPKIKTLNFDVIDFECKAKSRAIDLNSDSEGDLSEKLRYFSAEINKEILELSIKQSISRIPISETDKRAILAYSQTMACDL
jgi:choloylglycine hydrolase